MTGRIRAPRTNSNPRVSCQNVAVELVVVSINALTIEGSVDFESYDPIGVPAGNPGLLTVNSLSIAPTEGAIEITIGDRAQIIVAQGP